MLKPKFRILHDSVLEGYFPEVKYLLFWHPMKRNEYGFGCGFEFLESAEDYLKAFNINDYKIIEK